MEINVRETAGVPVLEVHGRLTIGEPAEQLHDALESVVQGGAKRVVVVLNGIPQIDSSGISTLVRISISWPAKAVCCASSAAPAASATPSPSLASSRLSPRSNPNPRPCKTSRN